MQDSSIDSTQRFYARLAGFMYLINYATSVFGALMPNVIKGSGVFADRVQRVQASELLYRGCSAPLDAPDFACGRCITTKVAKVTAIIHRIDDARGFDIHVPRSLGRSLWAWLADAGKDCALLIAASNLDPEPS